MTDEHDIIEAAARQILGALQEDSSRPGLLHTPRRVAQSLRYLTSGMGLTARDVVGDGIFASESEGMVLQRDIEFFSLCEHHLLPFYGQVHVAYLPKKKIIGLSKIGRIVDIYARRLQVQERLTKEVAEALSTIIESEDVAVKITASHFCMVMRGVEKQGAITETTEFFGSFKTDGHLRSEFLSAVRG